MQQPPPPFGRPAFSLTELLVVIAVISILAALVLTAVGRSKAAARLAQCQSNLKQMGVALQEFANDHGEFPLLSNPRYFEGAFREHRTGWWHALNEGYLGQPMFTNNTALTQNGVFDCPGVSQPADWPADWDFSDYGYNGGGLSGAGSDLGIGGTGIFDEPRPTRESEVRNPGAMLALGDGLRGWADRIRDGSGSLERSRRVLMAPDHGGTERTKVRHRARASVLFVDGHAEAIGLERMFLHTDDAALSLWNKDDQPHREKLE